MIFGCARNPDCLSEVGITSEDLPVYAHAWTSTPHSPLTPCQGAKFRCGWGSSRLASSRWWAWGPSGNMPGAENRQSSSTSAAEAWRKDRTSKMGGQENSGPWGHQRDTGVALEMWSGVPGAPPKVRFPQASGALQARARKSRTKPEKWSGVGGRKGQEHHRGQSQAPLDQASSRSPTDPA